MRTDLNLRMLDIARFHIGVMERGKANTGPMVEAFQKAVDGKASGESWCMAFLQYCLLKTKEVHGGRPSIPATESCLDAYNRTPQGSKPKLPSPGDWIIWRHGDSWQGHCGIITEVGSDYLMTVEGNTGPGQGIVREGDGVYIRRRPWDSINCKSEIGNMKLVGFLRAF